MTTTQTPTPRTDAFDFIVDAAQGRITGYLDTWTVGSVTEGGTYVIASSPDWNDDDQPHDLVAVLPAPIEGTRVLPLRPNVNPDLVGALRAALDTATEPAALAGRRTP